MNCYLLCSNDGSAERCLVYRVEVAEQDAMHSLMQSSPDLAQKLLIAVMRRTAPKRKADEIS